MKNLLLLFLCSLSCSFIFGQNPVKKISETEFSIGKTITIESTILGEQRQLNIYLPPYYREDSLKSYPVIYLLDGSKDEDFIHISGIVQFGSFSWINMIPESIVVGIGNVDRKKDFTFPSQSKRDRKEFPTTGGAENFISFIEKELQPFINSTYFVSTEKTIVGQSLGGLLATEILFKKPDLFDNYVIVSPSLWWDNENLLKENPVTYTSEKSIFIAVGKEGKVMERTARELHAKLEKSQQANTNLHFEYFPERIHGDILHQAAYNAFETIFKPEKK